MGAYGSDLSDAKPKRLDATLAITRGAAMMLMA